LGDLNEDIKLEVGSAIPTFRSYAPGPGLFSFFSRKNLGSEGRLKVGAFEFDSPATKYFPSGSNSVLG
jgi:hypothetical protein